MLESQSQSNKNYISDISALHAPSEIEVSYIAFQANNYVLHDIKKTLVLMHKIALN
jgi:hypothetical protein